MASLKSIRDGLKTALDTIDGLIVYDTVPGSIVTPCAIVQPETVEYQVTQGGATVASWEMAVIVLVQAVVEDTAQDAVDDYISPTGTSSVPAAIAADQDLGGTVAYAVVTEMDRYGEFTFNEVRYIGARFLVEVTA